MKKDVKMNALKSEAKTTSKDFQVLTDEALDQVFGGVGGSGGGSLEMSRNVQSGIPLNSET